MARFRTKKGNVTAAGRKRYGNKQGKYPIKDEKSARSAIKLRHHGKGVSASSVLNRVAAWARRNKKPGVLKAVQAARERDRKRRKK